MEEEGILPVQILWVQLVLILWAKTTKETADEYPLWLQAISSTNNYKLSPEAYKNVTDHDQVLFITGMQGSFNI